jgi:hypothetical protein
LRLVSHPSLGLPPIDPAVGDTISANALRAQRSRIADRAIAYAGEADPAFDGRYDATRRADMRLDVDSMVDRLADAVATNRPEGLGRWADMVVPRFRKRSVSMDDLTLIFEGLRRAAPAAVLPEAMATVDAALDAGIEVFKWHRRLAGDARKRHPLLAFIYKGA